LVGDFVKGLLEVDLKTKEVKILATSSEGVPIRFMETIVPPHPEAASSFIV